MDAGFVVPAWRRDKQELPDLSFEMLFEVRRERSGELATRDYGASRIAPVQHAAA